MPDEPAPRSRPQVLTTADGVDLECVWSGPDAPLAVVVLTHPHPRYGGDMHNAVPAGLARALPDHGVATLRFNFRGTGSSSGEHGGGQAEVTDVVAAFDAAVAVHPGVPLIGVGYSFGADVMLAVDDGRPAGIVAVAPPLAVLSIDQLRAPRGGAPTLVLAPAHDQFRPAPEAAEVTQDWPATTVEPVDGADHFLAGAVARVVERVATFVADVDA